MALLFAGHDPGSINHIRPLFSLAKSYGRDAYFLEMRAKDGSSWGGKNRATEMLDQMKKDCLGQGVKFLACVMGISTNKAELDLVEVCRESGVPTAMIIDFAPGHRLQTPTPHLSFPDLFLVTNNTAMQELIEKYEVSAECVVMGGSTYLESLAADESPVAVPRSQVLEVYSLPPDPSTSSSQSEPPALGGGARLVPMFLAPDDMVPEAGVAIPRCLKELAHHLPPAVTVIIRPHPRNHSETLEALSAMCSGGGGGGGGRLEASGDEGEVDLATVPRMVMLSPQEGAKVDNKSLCRACEFTLSMGSTVSVESMAWGTPSAFFQMGWDPSRIEAIMQTLPAPRLHSEEDLLQFIEALEKVGKKESAEYDIENCIGAAGRCWTAIEQRLLSK